ncbi:pancreatic lipase-related protein 2-like [Penaeus monodon]|uniref:pancreatic lipase-related protein 2-like n=1 Tax=Penaeus monodon TaxID=6687 RepID=UPI0018A736C6|nr:pancreatic lipase-related protein 2-like [Penaeus monodon]
MPAIGATKGAVLFHLLNINLLMDLGAPPPDPVASPTVSSNVEEVCHIVYGQRTCFSMIDPWFSSSRPVVKAPMTPEELGTAFTLFTRLNDTFPATLDPGDLNTIVNAPFIPGKPFKVVSHGYLSYGTIGWIKTMTGEFLRAADQNVIVVDWGVGARPPYTQAVANIRMVASQLAYLIYLFNKFADVPLASFHLLGHSLGAHMFGHTGSYLKKTYGLTLPRITGLDPAEPYFNDTHPVTRLDPSDADFVDIIHTDDSPILGFPLSVGMTQPIGHLDFFPNGGHNQPGCMGDVKCQHRRAVTYFTESIRQSCPMIGVSCPSYGEFIDGDCWGCDDEHPCSYMGLDAAPLPSQPQLTKLYLHTWERSPFCGYHYRVTVEFSNSTEAQEKMGEFGIIHLRLTGNKDKSPPIKLSEKSKYYEAGSVHRRVILTHDIGDLKTMGVTLEYPRSIMSWVRLEKPTFFLESITVEPLGEATKWKYCMTERVQKSGYEYILSSKQSC